MTNPRPRDSTELNTQSETRSTIDKNIRKREKKAVKSWVAKLFLYFCIYMKGKHVDDNDAESWFCSIRISSLRNPFSFLSTWTSTSAGRRAKLKTMAYCTTRLSFYTTLLLIEIEQLNSTHTIQHMWRVSMSETPAYFHIWIEHLVYSCSCRDDDEHYHSRTELNWTEQIEKNWRKKINKNYNTT